MFAEMQTHAAFLAYCIIDDPSLNVVFYILFFWLVMTLLMLNHKTNQFYMQCMNWYVVIFITGSSFRV